MCWLLLPMPSMAEETWWSLRALVRPEVPNGSAQNVVDRFVQEKQRELGLTGAKKADRRVLARRLAFDLWGMPMAISRVEAFVKDDREEAYEELVDELLASPRYGERWGRHWLDVVHFGETHGYDKDQPRENAWRYRDYVIRSLNEDKPYERFVREQLAGDVLWPGTEDGIVGPGFLSAGPWDLIGHKEVSEEKIDGRVARHLDRDDMVMSTMNVFCSLTVQCAQCHDHKADPVTMEDYYSLQAVFAALDRADREYDLDQETGEKRARLKEELREVKGVLNALGGAGNGLGYHSQVAKEQDVEKWVQVDLGKVVSLDRVTLRGAKEYGFEDFGFPHRFRVEVSELEDFRESFILRDGTGGDFERPGAEPIVIEGAEVRGRYVRLVATKLWSRRKAGEALSGDWIFALGGMEVVGAGKVMPLVGITALDSIEAMPRWGKGNLVIMGGSRREELDGEVKRIAGELKALPEARVAYVATVHHGSGNFVGRGALGGTPREVRVLDRGDVTRPLGVVQPGTVPGIVGQSGRFELKDGHSEGERRVALAEWMVNRGNGLTWRSIVNRVWQGHFGMGLVETANDFGRLGATPSHPKLLDWLAVEFRDGGGSFKNLHRLLVTSATYQQESQGDLANESRDGSNRFLWRQNRRRMEAEAIRDTVLMAAGKMNLKMGGPSFQDFVIEKPQHSPHYLYEKADPNDEATHRRSVYRFLVRSQPQPLMEALDCADPSLLVEKRGETTTALQALAMMNSSFVVTMAGHFARRIEEEEDVVGAAIKLALGRAATSEEREVLGGYAEQHGLTAMCRVIFNLSEFGYVD
ncbi:DUF1553 domain-containing protein [Verrucomicrobiaceae bacterium 227]